MKNKKKSPMKWDNLKLNKCPQCNKDFSEKSFNRLTMMIICDCGFKIAEERMRTIVTDRVDTQLNEEFGNKRG